MIHVVEGIHISFFATRLKIEDSLSYADELKRELSSEDH